MWGTCIIYGFGVFFLICMHLRWIVVFLGLFSTLFAYSGILFLRGFLGRCGVIVLTFHDQIVI